MNKKHKNPLIWFNIITIFPEMFQAISNYGIVSQAIKKKIINITCLNLRDFSQNKHRSIDDRPYGGGAGMLISFKPLYLAIQYAKSILKNDAMIIYLSPQGKKFKQKDIEKLINKKKIIFICGRYDGIDQRIIDSQVHEEWSIGNYILTGGELAAMVMIDAISRLVPGVIKTEQSIQKDSFSNHLLDYPSYTRPKIVHNMSVPKVLLSGNHKNIYLWRLQQSLINTWIKRPDILKDKKLNIQEQILLNNFKKHQKKNNS
ncbi:tRNA (guanosine(37)-N1)-methyltransferase TrmD [Buchnera aphidicola]|uniref:tRNA (guanosine(37)-N1)-methyltransferase TrmD n=1 Tax=Buchnera aphidicola TaxID=9 RepID=UPI003CE4A3B2